MICRSRSAIVTTITPVPRYRHRISLLVVGLLVCAAPVPIEVRASGTQSSQGLPWYITTPAIHRVTLKPNTKYWRFEHLPLNPPEAKAKLQELVSNGITSVEIFAPEEGGNSYDGLDAKDRYRLDPDVGSTDDFRNLVTLAHSLGVHVITFCRILDTAASMPASS